MRLNHHSGSLQQSLFTGLFISSAIAVIALLPIHQHSVLGVVLQMGVLTVLCATILEQRRKAIIRRTLELAFLNHHVRNALAQISMSKFITDIELNKQVVDDAIARISETLFHVASDETGLALDRDLSGLDLIDLARKREYTGPERRGVG